MAYLVVTDITKAQADFTDIDDFAAQLQTERGAAVAALLDTALGNGDLVTTSTVYAEDGDDFKATITSDWLDQLTYDTHAADSESVSEIATVEAAGYTLVINTP